MPNDPFRPNPRDAIPPQPTPVPPGTVPQSNQSVIFDFDPPSVAIAPGEQRTMIVRATGENASAAGKVEVRFDPAVAAVVAVRPLAVGDGVAEGRVEGNRVILDLPSTLGLTGTQSLAEITIRGIAPGSSKLSFENSMASGPAVVADASIEVRKP
jgi:hypothetical protein